MSAWGWMARRVQVLFGKRSAERELDEEMQFHLEMEIRQHVDAGVEPREARRRALVAFGGVERFKEEVRDVRGARVLDDFVQDVRVALRSFLKQPAFMCAVVVTLGVGIGGNVAMFGVLDASLFAALPFPESDRLVLGRVTREGVVRGSVSGRDFLDYREQASSFDGLAALTAWGISHTVVGDGEPHRVRSTLVSPDIFSTLGVAPLLGRDFSRDDGAAGAEPVVMLEHGYWTRSHGASSAIVGRAISVNGSPVVVAGVMPPGFRIIQDVDIFLIFREDDGWAQVRQFHNFLLIGRLSPDASKTTAQADIDVISGRLASAYPRTNEAKGLNLTPLREALIEDYRPVLAMLMAAVGLVLLIACGNVAGLLLARGSARRAEMSIRSVMGAGRWRLARQLLTENGLLAIGAGALGLLLAMWLQRGILAFVSLDRLGAVEPGLSTATLLFTLVLSMGTLAVFGALPAWSVARLDRAHELRSGSRTTATRSAARFRSVLVIAQVALTVVLLTGSGLLVRSFIALRSVDTGFDAERLLTAEVVLPSEYESPESRIQFFTQLQREVARVPSVVAATMVSALPIRDPGNNMRVSKPETFGTSHDFSHVAFIRSAWPGYFAAMGVPLLSGRDVSDTDNSASAPVIVLSEETARSVFGDEDPLGQTVAVDVGRSEPDLREVVGVVADIVTSSLDQGVAGAMYYPYHQEPAASMRLAVRTAGDAGSVTSAIRGIMHELESDVPLAAVATMDEIIDRSISGQKAIMTVIGLFAAVAALLAAVGLYSVLAYQVARRQHEIGVRIALGATVDRVANGVVRGGLLLAGAGLLVGIPAAMASTRLIQNRLFAVESMDPITYAVVAVFLVAVTTAACLVPARRAARVDPVAAFRAE